MMHLKIWNLLIISFLFYLKSINGTSEYFALKNPASGLVLDLDNDWIVLARYNGKDSQLWKLELAEKGLWFIVNKKEGKVLNYDTRGAVGNHSSVLVTKKVGATNDGRPIYNIDGNGRVTNIPYCQEWYVQAGGIIVNACDNYAVSIIDDYRAGAFVKTDGVSGGEHQKFSFVYVPDEVPEDEPSILTCINC